MDIVFYDSDGSPISYATDDMNIFLFSGNPIAYIVDNSIYDFRGRHLGWYANGWIRDHDGYCVFFTEKSSGGPMRPMRRMCPMKSMRHMLPMKGMRRMKPMRRMDHNSWSDLSTDEFFGL